MVNRRIILCLFVLFGYMIQAQQLNIDVFKGSGFSSQVTTGELFDNNGGIGVSYQFPVSKFDVSIGAEFRTIDWGNQVSLTAGMYRDFFDFGKFKVGLSQVAGFTVPLFYNEFLAGVLYGIHSHFSYEILPKHTLTFFVGARVDLVPSYAKYGNHRTSEFNYGLRYTKILSKDKE